jgi:hypothetical protein
MPTVMKNATENKTEGRTGNPALDAASNQNATMKYRYYSSTQSRHTLRSLDRHLPKIGCPEKVEARCEGKHGGWYELVVTGMLGKIVLRGCSWGYHGEGPHATRDALLKLGLPQWEADSLAFTTPNADVGAGMRQTRRGKFTGASVGKVYFRRTLLPQVPNGTTYEVRDGRVVILQAAA